ncbi:DUF6864 domain-containing function [Pantoea ananatis]|uniref:DUF6864 domain-containing function n=1 Tax=Pantoea ananas TaxID=553 RepID=UPI00301633D3
MVVSVSDGERTLLDTGVFNSMINDGQVSEVFFKYEGLKVKLVTKIIAETEREDQTVSAHIDNDTVILSHDLKISVQFPAGMIVPMQVGTKNDKKIYITWSTFIMDSSNGRRVVNTSYTFYVGD